MKVTKAPKGRVHIELTAKESSLLSRALSYAGSNLDSDLKDNGMEKGDRPAVLALSKFAWRLDTKLDPESYI